MKVDSDCTRRWKDMNTDLGFVAGRTAEGSDFAGTAAGDTDRRSADTAGTDYIETACS